VFRSMSESARRKPVWAARVGLRIVALITAITLPPIPLLAEETAQATRISPNTSGASLKARRDHAVVRQQFDYSCGAGAIATLMTYGLGDPTSELDVLASIFRRLSDDQEAMRRKDGLSLLDLQSFASERGYRAQGFRLSPEHLGKLRGPVIAFVRPGGYRHFTVLRGIQGDRVLLADPAIGNQRMRLYRFLHMWLDENGKGIVFVVEGAGGRSAEGSVLDAGRARASLPEVAGSRSLLDRFDAFRSFH